MSHYFYSNLKIQQIQGVSCIFGLYLWYNPSVNDVWIFGNGLIDIGGIRRQHRVKKVFNSMYARMFITLLFITVLPVILMQSIYTNYVIRVLRENRIELVRDYGSLISRDMLAEGYLSGKTSDVINEELTQFCSLYSGRAIVVDKDFSVKFDTDGMIQGLALVSEETVDAMKGQKMSRYFRSSDQILLTYNISQGSAASALQAQTQEAAGSQASGQENETAGAGDAAGGDVEGILIFVLSCQDLTNIYHNTVRNMSYIVFIALVILVLLSYSLSRKFADPFNSMVTSINRIAEGSFDEELNLKGFNEIEQLSDAFNTMMSRLRSLEDSRQEFVSNVSHELKTPLTSMKVLADSLNMQPDAPVEIYREFMQDITMEIDRETTIINDLLSLVKMDKTHSDINIGDVDVNAMLEALIKRVKPIAAKRNVTLQLEAAGQVSAQCDEIKMSLALSNLVENAIKYNVAGGWVHVSLDSDDQFFFVTVSDSGIGIPQEYQEKIFERFYRVDKARSRESGGTGLGLAITKTIVQMHHGAIKVSSKEEEGTTFSVRIPLVYHEEKEA